MRRTILPISTSRLVLRPYRHGDADTLLSYYSLPGVVRYTPYDVWSPEFAAEQLDIRRSRLGVDTEARSLSLVVEADGQPVGDVVLWTSDETLSRGELGWALHPDAEGHGYATEAVAALCALAFNVYGMHRLVAQVDPRNTGSVRLCHRIGMDQEGHLRKDFWAKGEWADTLVFALLAEDWAARPGS